MVSRLQGYNTLMASLHFRNISDNVFASDALEWETWLCCRAASRQLRGDAFSQSQTQNAKIFYEKRQWQLIRRHLVAAGDCALQTISVEPWIVQDPRCCYHYCRSKGRTGLYVPRHVGRLEGLSEEDIKLLKDL